MNIGTMITRSTERGQTNIDWLNSRHSFSFGSFYDPARMGFGPLRVVNDDHVKPKGGFPSHPHRDMEIISIVLEGELAHKDSLGNGRIIKAGEIQYMSAGSGVVHSEFNPSSERPVHFMQIWIQPSKTGLTPRYADQPLVGAEDDAWSLILSADGRNGSIAIRQDVELRSVQLSPSSEISYQTAEEGRGLWVFVIDGSVELGTEVLSAGDSIALADSSSVHLKESLNRTAKVLVFDLPLD